MSRTTLNVLEDQDNLILRLNGFIQNGNMRVIKPLHEPNFSSYGLLPLNIFDPFFFIDFEGHLLIQFLVHSNFDDGVSSLADLLANDVVGQAVLVGKNNLFLLLLGLGLRLLLGGPNLEFIAASLGRRQGANIGGPFRRHVRVAPMTRCWRVDLGLEEGTLWVRTLVR